MSKDRCGCINDCCDNNNNILGFGGCNWIWIILLVFLFCPGIFGGCCDNGCGNNNWIWIILLAIFFIPGFGFGNC